VFYPNKERKLVRLVTFTLNKKLSPMILPLLLFFSFFFRYGEKVGDGKVMTDLLAYFFGSPITCVSRLYVSANLFTVIVIRLSQTDYRDGSFLSCFNSFLEIETQTDYHKYFSVVNNSHSLVHRMRFRTNNLIFFDQNGNWPGKESRFLDYV